MTTYSKALCARTQRRLFLLMFLLATCGLRASAQETQLHGTLTHADFQHYREVPFTVPAGTRRITVQFSYTGREQGAIVDIGLWDPQGFRGWSGGNKSSFTVSATDATPSYLTGQIIPGTWRLMLGVPNMPEGASAEFTATVSFNDAGAAFSAVKRGARWYRGDLHMHNAHSDGSCKSVSGEKVPCPLFKTLEMAEVRGLDFVAVSDHNTISQFEAERELAPYFDNLLLLHGIEITTFQGHANVFGTDRFIDFRVGSTDVPDMNAVLRQVRAANAMISINHPARDSGAKCTGCGWTPHPDSDYGMVSCVEAVNSIDANAADSGIAFWERLLNRGFHLTGIGGSDTHDPTAYPMPGPGTIGYPTTVVFANELSEGAILAAIRAGHVFIDVEGTRDRSLEMTATTASAKAMMGDAIPARKGDRIAISVRVAHVSGGVLEIIEDGSPLPDARTAIASDSESKQITLAADGNGHWVRANVRSVDGKLLLVGNPIYLSGQE